MQVTVNKEMPVTPPAKYWRQRYDLFEEWENGIFADFEAWYSTTPVLVARHQAVECIRKRKWQNAKPKMVVVLDAFCGVGGNTIAFAKAGFFVIACDIDSEKIKMVCLTDSIPVVANPCSRQNAIRQWPRWTTELSLFAATT